MNPDSIEFSKESKIQESSSKLQKISECLSSSGIDMDKRVNYKDQLSKPTAIAGFPIDVDRNIRASYSIDRGLRIWFTNEFQDPSHPRRLEMIHKLQEQGLWNQEEN